MGLVLALAEDLLIDEWERVIVSEGKRTPETARSVSEAVRHFFATTRIEPAVYRHKAANVPGPDPGDRVHTAACAFGNATVLLTRNRRDFPEDFLTAHGVTVSSADDSDAPDHEPRPPTLNTPRAAVTRPEAQLVTQRTMGTMGTVSVRSSSV